MGMMSQIAGAAPTGSGNWIIPGDYLFEVKRLINREGGYKGDSFIAELQVIESQQTAENPPLRPGATCSWITTSAAGDTNRNIKLGNVKTFFLTLTQAAERELTEQKVKDLCNDPSQAFARDPAGNIMRDGTGREMPGPYDVTKKTQPCAGLRIRAAAFVKPTKAGKPFTFMNWMPVPAAEQPLLQPATKAG